jgi:hypothetical protein
MRLQHSEHALERSACRRGAILLEVLLALALLIFGLSVVGIRVTTSLESARKTQLWTTAVMLAETKLADLQAGGVNFKVTDEKVEDYFGIAYPGYSWQIKFRPCEIENLYLMTLQIGYNAADAEDQKENPQQDIKFEDDGTKIVRTVRRLIATPADLNLDRDFGINIEEISASMADSGTDGSGSDSGGTGSGDASGGTSELWNSIVQFLTEHPEILNDSGGIDLNAVKDLPAEDFELAMSLLKAFVTGGGNIEELGDKLDEATEDTGGKSKDTKADDTKTDDTKTDGTKTDDTKTDDNKDDTPGK